MIEISVYIYSKFISIVTNKQCQKQEHTRFFSVLDSKHEHLYCVGCNKKDLIQNTISWIVNHQDFSNFTKGQKSFKKFLSA